MEQSTVLMLDTRNFTNNLLYFSKDGNSCFLEFIQELLNCGTALAAYFSNNEEYYINSTGDGLLVIFLGNDNELRCYLLGLALIIEIQKLCDKFNESYKRDMSFGIGLESGPVSKIQTPGIKNNSYTYLGNAINTAARIEAETKSHARAKMLIGEELNKKLVTRIFNINYSELMDLVVSNADNKIIVDGTISQMNMINQKLLLSYIFEHNLKGLDRPIPLFRVSPTLLSKKQDWITNIYLGDKLDIAGIITELRM